MYVVKLSDPWREEKENVSINRLVIFKLNQIKSFAQLEYLQEREGIFRNNEMTVLFLCANTTAVETGT